MKRNSAAVLFLLFLCSCSGARSSGNGGTDGGTRDQAARDAVDFIGTHDSIGLPEVADASADTNDDEDTGALDTQDMSCVPLCSTYRDCGDDGCGGSCGTCGPGLECKTGHCVPKGCLPKCEGKMCGSDGCFGTCGTCPVNSPYCQDGHCKPQCTRNCAGRQCGDDGCGGSCGVCQEGWFCDATDSCSPLCQPQCFVPPDFTSEKECGWNGCPGNNVCGVCAEGFECAEDFKCVETRCSCEGKECGIPAEGCKSCGTCAPGDICDKSDGKCR